MPALANPNRLVYEFEGLGFQHGGRSGGRPTFPGVAEAAKRLTCSLLPHTTVPAVGEADAA